MPAPGLVDAPDLVVEVVTDAEVLPPDLRIVVRVDGVEQKGDTVADGNRASFLPEEMFPDDVDVEVAVEWSCGEDLHVTPGPTLHTNPFVQAMTHPSDVEGQTFVSAGNMFRVTSPAGDLGALLESALHMTWLPMLHVSAVDPERNQASVELFWADAAVPDSPRQRPCSRPGPVTSATFANPSLETLPGDFAVVTGRGVAHVEDLVIRGRFSQDGTELGDLSFRGLFDIRDVSHELGYGVDFASFCSDAAILGQSCTSCSDGIDACMEVAADSVRGHREPVALERADVCGIDGHLVMWNDDHLYRAVPFGDAVERVDFDGTVRWTAGLDGEIQHLQASTERDGIVQVRYNAVDGTQAWRDLDPDDGSTLEQGQPNEERSVETALSLLTQAFSGGCGAYCSVVPGRQAQWLWVGLVVAIASRRRAGGDR